MRVPEGLVTAHAPPGPPRQVRAVRWSPAARALLGGMALLAMILVPVGHITGDASSSPPHILMTVFENTSYSTVVGNPSMPYLNGLLAANGSTSTTDLSHPSLPNYLGLTSGSIYDNPRDTTPQASTYPGPQFTDELATAGIGWKAYIEDMSIACDLTDTFGPNQYDVNHNPFMYYTSVRSNPTQCNQVVPFTQLTADLNAGGAPPFVWVTPDNANDGHDGSLSTADAFLQGLVTQVQASSWWTPGSRIIVTWDEGAGSEQVLTLVVGSKSGTPVVSGNHYGTLRGLEEAYGVGLLGHSADANVGDLLPLLSDSATPAPTPTPSPSASPFPTPSPPPALTRTATAVTSTPSSQGYQRPAQDKVAYLHDGSLLIGLFDGSKGVIDQVRNPASSSQSLAMVQTISGDEVTLYTLPGATSTDIWIQAGAEIIGSAPLEQIRHGTYNGTTFTWDSATVIPGTVSPGRQDPSVTWTGKWLIATWWDDTSGSDSDNVFMNWTADKTGQSGWLTTAILMTTTNTNITQPNIRHSAKLGATVLVYGTHYRDFYRVLLDGRTDPSLGNWSAESLIDSGYDDSEAGYGGPQVAIDETTGNIHVFRAVLNAGGPTWHGVTYWLGRPGAVPMTSGAVAWNSRLIIDGAASTDPVDIAGAIDASGKVFVFWVTSASSGSLKYATLVSPYTTASSVTTMSTVGSQPRYPHVPAQSALNRGYVPLFYQSSIGSPYSIVLDTTLTATGGDTSPPTVPTGLVANASTSAPQVNLSWNASTDNVAVSGYTIYRGGSALGTVSGSTPAYTDNSVASLTTYSYAVDAFDAAGNHSAKSIAASVTTPDWIAPSVPAGATASAKSPTEIDLTWNPSTDNVGVTGYTVYRNGSPLATTAGTVTTFADTTVVASTTYSYTIDAFDAASNHSARSTAATATTPAVPDTLAPSVPTGVAAAAGPPGEVDVQWSASTDNVAVTGYTVYRDGAVLGTVPAAALTYADKTASGITSYSYTVDAFDAAGNHSNQSAAAVITTPDWTPPTTPTGLAANVATSSEIDLTWNTSTDNVAVTGYTVYRNGAAVGTTAGLTYADTGLGHGFTYTYAVDAFDAGGNHSVKSASASGTTSDDIAPTVPGNLVGSAASNTSVALSWNAATDNVGVAGYDVYRDTLLLATRGPSPLSFTDTVLAGSTHTYTVDAFDAAGNHSAQSSGVTVTTPSTPPSAPKFVQANVVTGGSRVTTMTVTLGPIAKGDLIVGMFGQYDANGQVGVTDNVNGAWTRSVSTTWRGSAGTAGDIALYYFANSAAAPAGLTITISAPTATYLQGSAGEYSGVAALNPLDQAVMGNGTSTTADSGLTPAVAAGELIYGGMVATNGAGTLTPGASQAVTFVERGQSSSGTQGEEDIAGGAAGQQHAGFTFTASVRWFMVSAAFRAG